MLRKKNRKSWTSRPLRLLPLHLLLYHLRHLPRHQLVVVCSGKHQRLLLQAHVEHHRLDEGRPLGVTLTVRCLHHSDRAVAVRHVTSLRQQRKVRSRRYGQKKPPDRLNRLPGRLRLSQELRHLQTEENLSLLRCDESMTVFETKQSF